MKILDVNRINFLAGVECALRDICTNCTSSETQECHGEQYQANFYAPQLEKEKEAATMFFNFLEQKAPKFFGNFKRGNAFEACQELAYQYVLDRFRLSDSFRIEENLPEGFAFDDFGGYGLDEICEDMIINHFSSNASVCIDKHIDDGKEYIFIE